MSRLLYGVILIRPARTSSWTSKLSEHSSRHEQLAAIVVDEAVKLHRSLGPGLLESVYEVTLADAIRRRGVPVSRQQPIGIRYRGVEFREAFRADLVIEETLIVEIKSIDRLSPAHRKQLITYLRLSRLHLGFLLNFGAGAMKDGIMRVVDRLPE